MKSKLFKKVLKMLARAVIGTIMISTLGSFQLLQAAEPSLTVAYKPGPRQDVQVKWMKKWAEERGVKLNLVSISYAAYIEKVSATFLAERAEYDVVWVNDDWTQMWGPHLEPVGDVKGIEDIDKAYITPFIWRGTVVGIPWLQGPNCLFYRKDIIRRPPETWKEMQILSQALQQAGKIQWGFVAGMKYPHGWGSWLWTMWSNGADVFYPYYERDNEVLAAYGWTPMVTDEKFVEGIEFWWDNIRKYKICPPGMLGYTREEGHKLFMAGKAAMEFPSFALWGEYSNPEKSEVAGKVGLAYAPYGPSGRYLGGYSLGAPWAWGIPKQASEEGKKLAKELIGFLSSEEVQLDQWKVTAMDTVNVKAREKLRATDPFYNEFSKAVHEAPNYCTVPAYYFPEWPEVYAVVSDYIGKAILGPREKIRSTMEELDGEIRSIMKRG